MGIFQWVVIGRSGNGGIRAVVELVDGRPAPELQQSEH
jgi:hypothetical protein